MEEYYYLCWFIMFIGWLLITAMGILCADDIQLYFDKQVEENNAKLNSYDKASTKQSILDHHDSNCNCGNSWTYCLFHSEY